MARPAMMGMFPRNVRRMELTDILLGGPVSVECSTNARYARHLPDNTRWIYKTDIAPSGVLAEAMGWLICDDLGIPIPIGAAVRVANPASAPRPFVWASAEERIIHWAPEYLHLVGNPSIFAAISVVDAWLGNPDRHDENLILRIGAGDSLDLLAIDFDGAWVGTPAARGRAGITAAAPDRITPLDPILWKPDLAHWVGLARAIPERVLVEYVREACELSGSRDEAAVLSWLRGRQDVLEDLAQQVAHHYEMMRS